MIPQAKIQEAIQILAETAKPKRIILFGSYATGQAHEGSDLDFLVIKETIKNYDEEIVDLELALLPLGISKDILLASSKDIKEWGHLVGSGALYWALKEGRVVYDMRTLIRLNRFAVKFRYENPEPVSSLNRKHALETVREIRAWVEERLEKLES